MIDLHLHLEGSLSKDDYVYLSKKQHIALGDDFPNNIWASDAHNKKEYLEKLNLPLSLLQNKESIEYASYSLVRRLYKEGYLYAEIRLTPLLHTQKGLTQDDVIDSAIDGMYRALNEIDMSEFDVNFILCLLREASTSENKETLKLMNKYRDEKIVALDLAGDEKIRSCKYFGKIAENAKELGFKLVTHAGDDNPNEIINAIDVGSERISGGIALPFKMEFLRYLTEKHVVFELCPTTYVLDKSIPNYESFPINRFMSAGINVVIGSGYSAINNTDIKKEFIHLIRHNGLAKFAVKQLLMNAINNAFIDLKEKVKFINLLNKYFDDFYLQLT